MSKNLMFKQYTSETKAVEGERALNVTITTPDVDRSGDVVVPGGAKLTNFKKNPVVLMSHDYSGLPIARATNLAKTNTGITAKVIFPEEGTYPLADTVFNLYKQGFMKAWSIGFIPIKSEDIVDDDDKDSKTVSYGKRFKTWELLEFSACSVPANPNALGNMLSKGIDVEPLKEAGFIEIEDEKVKYKCECIKCDYKMTSDKHCKEIKCPKCGGTMRRVERPGPGEETNMTEDVITKPEETDDLIRIPAKGEEGKHKGHKIRWITILAKEGIRGIYCIDCKKIITFVFDKKKGWTMEKAKKWMADHGKAIDKLIYEWLKIEHSSESDDFEGIEEQIGFILEEKDKKEDLSIDDLINKIFEGITENKELKEKLEELELKAGAVLNAKNKKDLKNAQALIQSVLDSATTGEEEDSLEITDEKGEDDKGDNTVIDLTTDTADDPLTDEEKDEDKIEVDEKVIAETIEKHMNYLVGKLDKSDT